ATFHYLQGKYDDAEKIYKRMLASKERSIGRQNPQIVSALSNLAMVYQAQHKFAQSESLYKEVVAICEKSYPPDHPEVVAAIYNLANMYQMN
ncbi:tetratricopeptide repeat protein, partial [Acinetobacter baumannii]